MKQNVSNNLDSSSLDTLLNNTCIEAKHQLSYRNNTTMSVGIDIVEVSRICRILSRTPSFKTKIYTFNEQKYCDTKNRPEYHYSTRFAAKEAVVKALGTGFYFGIKPSNIEVNLTSLGKPYIKLHEHALEIAKKSKIIQISISLSFTNDFAIACAIAMIDQI